MTSRDGGAGAASGARGERSIAWASTLADVSTHDTQPTPEGAASFAASVAPTPPARYEPLGVLGQGGMGRVLEARDRQFGRVVALKEMIGPPSVEGARRFLVESVVTANLEHPSIVPVYERGVRDGVPYYAMRRVVGRTLGDAMREATTLEARLRLLPSVVRAAHALGFAHERGVVHRDVKPENVLLGDHGETVLLDWGVAKVRELPDLATSGLVADANATAAGSLLGTPAYMAPEQARGDVTAIGPTTDVFAVGAILFELLSGRPLYAHTTPLAAIAAASESAHPSLDEIAPEVPAGLRAIVSRALAPRPEDRPADCAALARELEGLAARSWLAEEPPAARWLAWTAATLGLAAALAFTVGIWTTVPSLRQLGWPSSIFVGTGLLALLVVALDWWTCGRHRTLPLAAGLAVSTPLLSIALAAGGLVRVFGALREVGDDAAWRSYLSSGLYELSGNVAVGAALGALAAIGVGVTRWRNGRLAPGS